MDGNNDDIFAQVPRRTASKSADASQKLEGLAAGLAKAKAARSTSITAEQDKQKEHIFNTSTTDDLTSRRRRNFKIAHGFLLLFFVWLAFVQAVGIFLFKEGFLLSRLVLDSQSYCNISPLVGSFSDNLPTSGCWHEKTFDKAIIIIIDALRYDFTVPKLDSSGSLSKEHYHNHFTTAYDKAMQQPEHAILLPFIADPPTATLQRLKGLTTGTLPTFIDLGSNFAGTAIEEDNIIAQLRRHGKRIAFMGDDTWTALYPNHFDIEHPYESLNVWDLHTVDNGVLQHMLPLLQHENSSSWDIMIAHFLGVDHAGHRYGPDHPAMAAKLKQMDGFVKDLIERVDDETLVVIMGDHGMDPKGDHGGESQLEVEAALWMYSKKNIFGRLPGRTAPPADAKEHSVGQIDIVPTLSLLLGLPIPFNNLGIPILEAFIGPQGDRWENLAKATRLTSAQIDRYQKEYAIARNDVHNDTKASRFWQVAEDRREREFTSTKSMTSTDWQVFYQIYLNYQSETLQLCKDLWARFDLISMFMGIILLVGSLLCMVIYARAIMGDVIEITGWLTGRCILGTVSGSLLTYISQMIIDVAEENKLRMLLFGSAFGGILSFLISIISLRKRLQHFLPVSIFSVFAVIFTIAQGAMFAANSFTIWEDKILTFFLTTFGFLALLRVQREQEVLVRYLGSFHCIVFMLLTRLASISRLCREEQMPYCNSTYYASATSSVSSPLSLVGLYCIAFFFPSVVKSFYKGTKSYEGPAVIYIGLALRVGLMLNALYWTLDSADNGDWIDTSPTLLKQSKHAVAQVVLAMAFIVGNLGFGWAEPCLNILFEETDSLKLNGDGTQSIQLSNNPHELSMKPTTPASSPAPKTKSMILLGYANLHGSRSFLLAITWYLGLALLQKPIGGASLAILMWQALSLLEIADCNSLQDSPISAVVLGMLGSSHYFSTGHQATLSSLQWESVFIPTDTIRHPWSFLVFVGNTFGPQILATIIVPTLVLWKQQPKEPGLLGRVAKVCATYVCYHATIATCTVLWASHLRRHLMLYRVFSPRFMLGASVLLVIDVVIAFVSIMGTRWNFLAIGEVFGFS